MKPNTIISLILLAFTFSALPSEAVTINAGDCVKLNATHADGVPLHRESRSSMFMRLPDESVVRVLQTTNSNWIEITHDSRPGWIVKKYVENVVPCDDDNGDDEVDYGSVWENGDQCDTFVRQGSRLPRGDTPVIRVVTWNIRWFPTGTLYGNNPDKFTDQSWLSCALAWLDADIIAVQEILTNDEAETAMENVIDGLQGFNGGDWRVDLQQCGHGRRQHVGFIYNADRVKLSNVRDMYQFNGASSDENDPCDGNLRPGRYAYVESRRDDGFDFHLVSVHTDSGTTTSDLANRNRVLNRLDQVASTLTPTDEDIVIIGDFNTMGATGTTAEEELEEFSERVDREDPGFVDVPIEPECTEYFRGNGGRLDHIVVTEDTEELVQQTAIVHGYCYTANCERLSTDDMPTAYQRLSDHCPVVIDFVDEDRD